MGHFRGLRPSLLSAGHKNIYGENDITVYWIINDQKTAINAVDFVIEDLTLVTLRWSLISTTMPAAFPR